VAIIPSKKTFVVYAGHYLLFIDPAELAAIDPRCFVHVFAEN
jgi:hypothetical protein